MYVCDFRPSAGMLVRVPKKLSINPIFGHLHICFIGTVHQKYQVPQRISPKREIHISPPPKPIPISHLPSRGKRPMFHGLNSAASEPFNKLSQICQNWVSPPTSDNHPPNRERIYKEWGNRIRGGGRRKMRGNEELCFVKHSWICPTSKSKRGKSKDSKYSPICSLLFTPLPCQAQ